jgi:cation diffusion facilitator CzcD-associated flavoprotein CzcO
VTDAMTQAEPAIQAHEPVHTRAVIIGTGFSGLGLAIALQ